MREVEDLIAPFAPMRPQFALSIPMILPAST
jgi:hypothetical protein